MTVQRSFYSPGEIAREIVIFYPYLSFQLHEITPVAYEAVSTETAGADNFI